MIQYIIPDLQDSRLTAKLSYYFFFLGLSRCFSSGMVDGSEVGVLRQCTSLPAPREANIEGKPREALALTLAEWSSAEL